MGLVHGLFNLVGLVGGVASVDYGCATFLNATFMLFGVNLGFANWADSAHILTETFLLFMAILTVHALINIYSSPLVALLNNVSVFWHVAGVAAIVLVLVFVPDQHQSVDFVFTETINNSGFGGGMFWFYVLPLGFHAPITVGGLLLVVGVWWGVRAKHTFTGPVRTVEFDEGAGVS